MFQAASIIVVLAALASYINARFLKLPSTSGVTLIAIFASIAVIALGHTAHFLRRDIAHLLGEIRFDQAVLHGLLAFLLFAGSLDVKLSDLKKHWGVISSLAVVGTLVTAALVGVVFHLLLAAMGLDPGWLECFLFGALISPTDPVAVLGILKSMGAPKSLETQMTGESLFNDGVGVVLFLALVDAINEGTPPTPGHAGYLLLRSAVGALIIGIGAGGAAYQMLKRIDNYQVEVFLSLALAMGCYALAERIDVSAPVAVVVAGLFMGNLGREFAMSRTTERRLDDFWELIDEMLNVVLFMLVGVHILVLPVSIAYAIGGLAAIVTVIAARWMSVAGIISLARAAGARTGRGTIRILTWGGLRGGLSLAMALSLPDSVHADLLLAATYCVVVFSVVVQGLTIGPLVRKLTAKA